MIELKACLPNSRIRPKFWYLRGTLFTFWGKRKYNFPENIYNFLWKFGSVVLNTTKLCKFTRKPFLWSLYEVYKLHKKGFLVNLHHFLWKFCSVVFNTTVSVVLILPNKISIKSEKYFQGYGIFFFSKMWKECHANSRILA